MFFIVLIVVCLIAGYFCSMVANEKGYRESSWFVLGFLFSLPALIAVAGLPDRKLRKYIRLIGEKQNAIKIEKKRTVLSVGGKTKSKENSPNEKIVFENFEFTTSIDANKDEVYKEFVKVLTITEDGKKAFDSINVDSYEIVEPLFADPQLVVVYANGQYNFVVTSEKVDSQRIWQYSDI